MQTRSVGGSAQTEATAEQVTPAMPAGPAVVTTVTAVTARARASRNSMSETPPWANVSTASFNTWWVMSALLRPLIQRPDCSLRVRKIVGGAAARHHGSQRNRHYSRIGGGLVPGHAGMRPSTKDS